MPSTSSRMSGPCWRRSAAAGATSVQLDDGEVEGFAFDAFGPAGATLGDPTESHDVTLGLRKSAGGTTSGVMFLQFTFKLG